jgi:hypothetical protein
MVSSPTRVGAAAALLSLQDIFALLPRYSRRPAKEEVINDPTVSKHYWRYRWGVAGSQGAHSWAVGWPHSGAVEGGRCVCVCCAVVECRGPAHDVLCCCILPSHPPTLVYCII